MSTLFPKRRTELFPSLLGSGLETDFFNKFFGETHFPQVDIKEKEGRYEFMVDLPGFTKEDIDVEYKDGYLEIRGKKEQQKESEEQDGRFIRKERSYGSFRRSFYIGEIEQDKIAGSFKEGVLMLDVPMPKNEQKEEKTHRIMIE
ncbi:Hsp20/alpha crystallin family protein [Planococcus sp. N028]|uniref:Hsp20/alpha crystallin family protein n=1 Tax=Planococcus shixiaomingii TaxID=3058393 RepID=A0ABT8N461_9BACL|nr:Hsp20/alpha crystallin family protein [Planococcus sp. N028]MDN7242670.1 Hsp20/alpha crystallin family protein [Planococcus sp. N028]